MLRCRFDRSTLAQVCTDPDTEAGAKGGTEGGTEGGAHQILLTMA